MINNLTIKGYRVFQQFQMNDLSRINLLVGTNNSGKTSALEALYVLATNSDPQTLWKISSGRGELRFQDTVPQRPMQQELELNHLFNGHKIGIGTTTYITASDSVPNRAVELSIIEAKMEDNPQLFMLASNEIADPLGVRLALSIKIDPSRVDSIPLTPRGTIRQDSIQVFANISANTLNNNQQTQPINTQYVTNASLTAQELTASWGSIVLTDDENRVVEALQSVDKDIEKIAATNSPIYFGVLGGFVVKMRNVSQPIPIGSLGYGVWRMLALAIALIRSRNGILLIDEIDTGLHYSVMSRMWKMINDVSRTFNIQVFATSHSYDCIRALASIDESEISIHRIEPDQACSVQFSADEIKAAAEFNIEVR